MTGGEEAALLARVPEPLLDWYRQNARVLPWRSQPTPSRVWVSEIMLQQTRVEAAKPYFLRFVEALPDARALADCPEEQLMKLWEGLGYYSRARNLQKAARVVAERYGGELPASFEALRELPGIGDYTAGAIASIAFGLPCVAVDGNVLRVVARILGSGEDVTQPAVKQRFRELVVAIQPPRRPGDFNQALMELGAIVCLPGGPPKCEACPAAPFCRGYQTGCAAELPVKAAKRPRRQEKHTVFALVRDGRALLHKREKKGLLAGMWELPSAGGHLTGAEALAQLEAWGLTAVALTDLGPAKHIFTHVEWHMTGYLAQVTGEPPDGWASPTLGELEELYALPGAFQAYLSHLKTALGRQRAVAQ